MKTWIGWRTALVLAVVTGMLLLGANDLPDQERAALANVLVLVGFAAAGTAIYRMFRGDRGWQRRLQAWMRSPVTHWNDWRAIGLLAGNALGLYVLGLVDLPERDRWSSASVLLLLTLCLALQMISVAFFKKRDRK
jgi:hypothetical protein